MEIMSIPWPESLCRCHVGLSKGGNSGALAGGGRSDRSFLSLLLSLLLSFLRVQHASASGKKTAELPENVCPVVCGRKNASENGGENPSFHGILFHPEHLNPSESTEQNSG